MQRPSFQFYPGDWQSIVIDQYAQPQIPPCLDFRGVYLWTSPEGQALYIGESRSVRKRLKVHFAWRWTGPDKGKFMFDRKVPADHPAVWVLRIDDLAERLTCEKQGIEALNPLYNVARSGVWRYDKYW